MAYRRRQGISRSSTFKEETRCRPNDDTFSSSDHCPSSASLSIAAKAIRASAARHGSPLSSVCGDSALACTEWDENAFRSKSFSAYGRDSSPDARSKSGFWGVLARKAKAILEEENASEQFKKPIQMRRQMYDTLQDAQQTYPLSESLHGVDNPTDMKDLHRMTYSLDQMGYNFDKAFEEGGTSVEIKTHDIIHETRKLQMRRNDNSDAQGEGLRSNRSWQPLELQNQIKHENQLKASRDVAMATAAKAKLLLRELKTVKADLDFAKLRCSQLEEENKVIREGKEKGGNAADDDLHEILQLFYETLIIRLQLETLLAEKARLAHENETYARENRFLREIVEYHQLTMQDFLELDGGIEEVTDGYPIHSVSSILSMSPPSSPKSPPSPITLQHSASGSLQLDMVINDDSEEQQSMEALENSDPSIKKEEDQRGQSGSPAKA